MKCWMTVTAVAVMILAGTSYGAVIGDVVSLNWRYNDAAQGTLASDGTTQSGVLDSVHWTTATTSTNVLASDLKNHSGDATTVDILLVTTTAHQQSNAISYNGSDDDLLMLSNGVGWRGNDGLNGTSNNSHAKITVSQVPYDLYDVIIYVARNTTASTARFSLGSMTSPTDERYISTQQPGSAPVTWTESTATTLVGVQEGNYVRFTGLTSENLEIFARSSLSSGSGRVVISGIQIVQIPEPATLGLLALGGLLMMPRSRKTRSQSV